MNRCAMPKLFPLILATLFAVAGCGPTVPEEPPLAGAAIGGPFTLVDKNHKTVEWSAFAGKYRVVYFGYTFCPDACPMDVAVMMRGYDRFAKASPGLAKQIQPIFISIDPLRDTPRVVGEFTAAFSPRLLGLTGSEQAVAAAAKNFAAPYARAEESAGGYLMDHSRIVYLMGRKGEPITMLPVDKGADAVAAELKRWVH